ncbi:MAG: polysaccharide biosynthesis tyrosine autokinase [Sedimentisphaerales bacterium]|nr:polysaccharide biosynthesis tyrosine autokinase [Sedimentisphaerales bacterium]
MDELMKYEGGTLGPPMEAFAPVQESASANTGEMFIAMLLRRWPIVVIVFTAACILGIPFIWHGLNPVYEVTGAIKVAPILSNILTGEQDRGEISNYQSFMNTQAKMIASPQVIQRVADDLVDKNLSLFNAESSGLVKKARQHIDGSAGRIDYAARLKLAIANGVITITPERNSELITITMRTAKPQEAGVIVDAFIRAYMAVEGLRSTQDEDQKLNVLESERRTLLEKLQNQQNEIKKLAMEFGTASLDDRQRMMLEKVSQLLSELTQVEAQRINIESRIEAIESGSSRAMPEEWLNKRKDYINSDPAIQELVRNLARLEQDMMASRQLMTSENPLLKQKEEFVASFEKRLNEKRQEVGKDFDIMVVEEVNLASKNELLNLRGQLAQVSTYENRLKEKLAKEDAQAIEVGRKHLNIQEMQNQFERDNQMYDTVIRRIQEMEMERKQPARISIAYTADVTPVRDKRMKFTMALIVAAAAGSVGLAFLRDKLDHSVHSPDDVVKCIGVRIIGTTTSPGSVERKLLPRQLTEDYQTIRANLKLIDGEGIPKKLVVTSAGMRDGKTTFSINIATSLSKSGHKVILIDGDLRKPDIGRLLNVSRGARNLQDLLSGSSFDDSLCIMVSPGLFVLAADSQNEKDPYELLIRPETANLINMLSDRFDYVIIDTPPVLAFPDALIWAKIAGSVILTSFAGHTNGSDLREARDRLSQINVKIVGTVMNNVHLGHAYYRYGYNYYSQSGRSKRDRRHSGVNPLLFSPDEKEKKGKDSHPQS